MRKAGYFIILMILVATCSEAGIIKVMAGMAALKYNFENAPQSSKMVLTGGFGFEGYNRLRFEVDLLVLGDKKKFDIGGKRSYYKFINGNMDCLLKYKFKNFNSPYFLAGGTIGFMSPQKTDSKWQALKNVQVKSFVDYGAVIGLGLELDFKKSSIMVEGRYRIGLATHELENRKFKCNGFFMMCGFRFF